MRIVILGAGSVGLQVARQLVSERHDVAIVESNAETVQLVSNSLDCLVIHGEASDLAALRRAGAAGADFLITLTGSDETNIIACSMAAREFPRPRRIARVRSQSYASFLQQAASSAFGIDWIINPEVEAARAILSAVEHGAEGGVIDLGPSGLHLQSLRVEEGSTLAGRSVGELRKGMDLEFLVPVIVRGEEALVPSGSTVVAPGDEVSLLADEATLAALVARLGRPWTTFRRVAVFGGGRIGSHVVGGLLAPAAGGAVGRALRRVVGGGRQITVFEQSVEKCKALAAQYPAVQVTHADVSDEQDEEGEPLSSFDLAIAVTGNQELNLVTAANAKIHGARKSIALVIKNDYLRIARHMPIDVTVSRKATVARSILSLIRGGILRSVQSIGESELEIMELTIDGGSDLAGRSIRDAGLPRDCLVLFVVREGRTLLPDGSLVLAPGDEMGMVARRAAIRRLEERFLRSP